MKTHIIKVNSQQASKLKIEFGKIYRINLPGGYFPIAVLPGGPYTVRVRGAKKGDYVKFFKIG